MSGGYFAARGRAGRRRQAPVPRPQAPRHPGDGRPRACAACAARRADFVTVHYDRRVLEAACRERGELGILAVTLLTSVGPDDLRALGYAPEVDAADLVLARARDALEIGCTGVIASPLEAPPHPRGRGPEARHRDARHPARAPQRTTSAASQRPPPPSTRAPTTSSSAARSATPTTRAPRRRRSRRRSRSASRSCGAGCATA